MRNYDEIEHHFSNILWATLHATYQRIFNTMPVVTISSFATSLSENGGGFVIWDGQVADAGDTVQITVTFSNNVRYDPASGPSTLTLSNGLVATCISAASGNGGTTTLVFQLVLPSPPPAIDDLQVQSFNSAGCTPRPGDTLNFGAQVYPVEFAGIQQIVCFLRSTRIAVPGGERAVESLRVGDLICLADPSGEPRRIKWIGRRSYSAHSVARHRTVHPVIIHQDALANGVPSRDLAVSPMHAVNIGGVFYPAIALLNGISISRAVPDCDLDYFHIELDTHETILAEGAPVESYRDDGCRFLFDNADSYFDWHGSDVPPAQEAHWRVDGGSLLNIVRGRLAERAGADLRTGSPGPLAGFVERIEHGVLDGWAIDTANPMSPVLLEILIHGKSTGRTIANMYRVDLDHHRIGHGIGGFRFTLPKDENTSLDAIEVRRISDGAVLSTVEMAEAE